MGGTSIEQGWRSVSEVSLGHEIVGFDGTVDVVAMDTYSDSHDEVLWPFGSPTIDLQKIRAL